ncbi:MAG: hypothetical protein IPP48_08605 [Chitinophagaceae bacterium]|nr:hypothetical protein [Chitinophagaceae bacterium]
MKYVVLLIAFSICKVSAAQHCPYDGSYLIAVKLVDKKGNMINTENINFYLQEVDNKLADSCTSAAGTIKKQLLTTSNYIKECNERWDRNGYNKKLIDRLTKAHVFLNNNRFVYINQGEHTCTLIGKSETVYTNYIYTKRKFVINYTVNKKEVSIKVPPAAIYSLCTNSKDLQNFKPIVIKLL